MKILVIGATGRTGRKVVDEGCSRGHAITAVVRKPGRLRAQEGLMEVLGDPLDPACLRTLIDGVDTVISALGARPGEDRHLLENAAEAMLEVLGQQARPRYIVISQGLLFRTANPFVHLLRRLLENQVADSRAMERLIEKSGASWTIVRPPRLTDAARRRRYRVRRAARPEGFSMSRHDLARYLLDEAESGENARVVVGVT